MATTTKKGSKNLGTYDGEYLRVVAHFGETSEQIALLQSQPIRAIPENKFGGRVLFEKRPIHILDAQAAAGSGWRVNSAKARRLCLLCPSLRNRLQFFH
jgi:hypothetical protein